MADISSLSISQSTYQEWIISPKGDTLGQQLFSILLYNDATENDLARADITVDVKDISGLNPTFVGLLGSAGTFLLGLFGILKIIPETWALYKGTARKKSKSKK